MGRIGLAVAISVCLLASITATAMGAGGEDQPSLASVDLDVGAFAETFGTSLEEAAARLTLRDGLDPAIEFIKSHPDSFGGVYIDQEAGGLLDVATVGDDEAIRSAVHELLPADASVRWRTVDHSLAVLHKVRDTLIARAEQFAASGSPVSSISVNPLRNIVVLTVDGPTDDARASLEAEFSSAIEVVAGPRPEAVACVSRLSCDPRRGGIAINPGDGVGLQCTYGFNARSSSGSTRFMLTAGHCDNETWKHDGFSIGTTDVNNILTSGASGGDFQRVPTFHAAPTNIIYVSETERQRSIWSVRGYTNQTVGDLVCASSRVWAYRCGPIVDDDFWYCFPFRGQDRCMWGKIAGSAADTLRSDFGDSGGPVFIGSVALGAISAKIGTTQTIYGVLDIGMDSLGVRLCLNSLCS